MKVKFTASARAQFLEYVAFIAADDPAAALRWRDNAADVLRRLETFPGSGRSIPEFPHLPHREVVVRPCRFFYRVNPTTDVVWVVGVWHSAQQPEEP